MNKFLSLVLIQLRDKLDLSWLFNRKKTIQKAVFGILKFAAVTGFVFLAWSILLLLGLFEKIDAIPFYILFLSIYFVLNLISGTIALMKDLYLSEDNKVLVTFPVSSSFLFFSKMVVYYIFELKRSLDILIPVTIGFMLIIALNGQAQIISIFWSIIVLLVFNAIIVLLEAILSVPALFIKNFLKRYMYIEFGIILLIIVAAIWVIIFFINKIPPDIDIVNDWPSFRSGLRNFCKVFSTYSYPLTQTTYIMVGETGASISRVLKLVSFGKFGIMLGGIALLSLIIYFGIKPFYFYMMTKGFEFDKKIFDHEFKNVKRKRIMTFANKEMKINFRDIEISGSYLIMYIIIPILLLFMDRVFSAISTRLEGDIMTYAFNILLIILPLLASNSLIATLYSKEGRAAYIKKTKPIDPLVPLISKLLFNLLFCIPSILGCAFVFNQFANVGIGNTIMLAFFVLFIQYAHIFYSASLDIMNPQNEIYATEGEVNSNPNENVSTAVAFVFSLIAAFVSFVFFKESHLATGGFTHAFVKLLLISATILASSILLFVLKVKAYYYEK